MVLSPALPLALPWRQTLTKERDYKLAEVRRRTGKSYASLHKLLGALNITPRPSGKDARALVITGEEFETLLQYLDHEREEAAQATAMSGGGGLESNQFLAQIITAAMARDAQHDQFIQEQRARSEALLRTLDSFESRLVGRVGETATVAATEAVRQELRGLREQMATSDAAHQEQVAKSEATSEALRQEMQDLREQVATLTKALAAARR